MRRDTDIANINLSRRPVNFIVTSPYDIGTMAISIMTISDGVVQQGAGRRSWLKHCVGLKWRRPHPMLPGRNRAAGTATYFSCLLALSALALTDALALPPSS